MNRDKVKPEERVLRALRALSVGSYLFQCRVAAELKLHPTDLQALHAIGAAGSMTAGALAEELQLTSGATTAAIDRLERLGYLSRERDTADRRKVVLKLRTEGVAPLRGKYRGIDAKVRRLLSSRTRSEVETIAAFLVELTANGKPE